ncbi:MAG: hypothetical protein IK051_01215 [Rhodocyclaceae bacterium]|nr:hypothetical protein [Rhodocyclaceae bacterium]
MARKKSTTEIIVPTAHEQAAAEVEHRGAVARADAARLQAEQIRAAELRSACARFGYAPDGDITVEAIEADIVLNLRLHNEHQRAADESLFRAGIGLLVLRDGCERGQWQAVLDRIGFGKTHAWRLMEVAQRFTQCNSITNVPSVEHLSVQARFPQIVRFAGNVRKLAELTVLDDDELETLENTGELMGFSLADVGAASARKLREIVREANKKTESLERELRQTRLDLDAAHRKSGAQAAEIESLHDRLQHKDPPTGYFRDWETCVQNLTIALTDVRTELAKLAGEVREAREASMQAGRDEGVYLSSLLQQIENDAALARHEIGLPEIGRGNAALDFVDAMTGGDNDEVPN